MRPLLLFAAVAACTAAKPAEAPAPPETVRALRYRVKVYDSPLHYVHRMGRWIDEIYLPGSGVLCNVDFGGFFGRPGTLNAFRGGPRHGEQPVEEIEIPADLAADIVAMAEGRVFSRHPATIASELYEAELLRPPGWQGMILEA